MLNDLAATATGASSSLAVSESNVVVDPPQQQSEPLFERTRFLPEPPAGPVPVPVEINAPLLLVPETLAAQAPPSAVPMLPDLWWLMRQVRAAGWVLSWMIIGCSFSAGCSSHSPPAPIGGKRSILTAAADLIIRW
jgi:hypothetical protein